MTLKFLVPPTEQYNFGVWTEGGGFRAHRNSGSAKQSAMARTGLHPWNRTTGTTYSRVVITQLVNGEWYTVYDVPKGTVYNGLPWIKEEKIHKGYEGAPSYKPIYSTVHRSRPMDKEEYAEWRIAVELERRGIEV